MFFNGRDKSETGQQSGRRNSREAISLISSELCVSGSLVSAGDVHIDGAVEGDIHCQSLTIGATATVTGNIIATDVLIRGALIGSIEARSVTLGKTARVTGDILHETIAIEAGAMLDGRLTGHNRVLEAAMESLPSASGISSAAPIQVEPLLRQAN